VLQNREGRWFTIVLDRGRKEKRPGKCPVSQNFLFPPEPPDPRIHLAPQNQLNTLRRENGAGAAAPKLPPVGDAGAAVWLIQYMGLIISSSLEALCVQYRTLRDDTLWFCGVIGNATKFYVRQRYQTEQVLGGRPRLRCLTLCMKVDARCLLSTVCPAQKQIKTFNLPVAQVCPVLNPQVGNHLLVWVLNLFV